MIDAMLINPPFGGVIDDALEENLGLAYIAGFLQSKNLSVEINEMTGNIPLNDRLKQLDDALVYGISYYSTASESVTKIVDYIRSNKPNALIYIGGPHPSALPEATLKKMNVHGVVVGEGEEAFYKIVRNAKAMSPMYGVIHGQIIKNMDEIPFPVRTVNRERFTRRLNNEPSISLLSSRGCPYKCLHCNSLIMGGGNPNIRFRSIDNVIEEIRLLKSLGYTKFRFNDDNFSANPNLKQLLSAIEKEQINYRVFGRIEHLTEPVCQLLKKSGCCLFSVGIESCNPDNLKFIGKAVMLNHLSNLAMAKKHGITIRASFMVGLPFDTDESVSCYFNKAAELDFDEYAIYGLIPYPGTSLHSNPAHYHYEILSYDYSTYMQMDKNGESCFVLRYDDGHYSFEPDDVRRWHDRANKILGSKKTHMRYSSIA